MYQDLFPGTFQVKNGKDYLKQAKVMIKIEFIP